MRKSFSKKQRQEIFEKTKGRCGYCGIELKNKWHVEHITACYKNGTNELDNLMPSCVPCNTFKDILDLEQFRNRLMELRTKELQNRAPAYRAALRFGLVIEPSIEKIVFHFEKKNKVEIKETLVTKEQLEEYRLLSRLMTEALLKKYYDNLCRGVRSSSSDDATVELEYVEMFSIYTTSATSWSGAENVRNIEWSIDYEFMAKDGMLEYLDELSTEGKYGKSRLAKEDDLFTYWLQDGESLESWFLRLLCNGKIKSEGKHVCWI